MSSGRQRSSRHSLLYRDLASPVSASHRGGGSRFGTPGQAAAVSALWRENFSSVTADPPPPPVFTLDDRAADFSPELLPTPPSPTSSPRSPTPTQPSRTMSSSSAFMMRGDVNGGTQAPDRSPSFIIRGERSGSYVANGGGFGGAQQTPTTASWWSPARGGVGESSEKGKGSPVDGVVHRPQTALLTLPPPTEVARPEVENSTAPPLMGSIEEEEWVTVFGFAPSDTNLVIREFEKCGVILKHVPGPRDSNWMHLLYQNRYDAQKALGKNGSQINSVLLIGVKPVDPVHRQYLKDKLSGTHHGGFMVSFPPKSSSGASVSARPSYLQNGSTTTSDSGRKTTGAIATPSKSVVSKVMDLMFGI